MTKLTLFPWLGLCAVPIDLSAAVAFPLAAATTTQQTAFRTVTG